MSGTTGRQRPATEAGRTQMACRTRPAAQEVPSPGYLLDRPNAAATLRDHRRSGQIPACVASSTRNRAAARSIPATQVWGRCSTENPIGPSLGDSSHRASANVLPTTGWPAIGNSLPGVKIRMRTSVPGRSAAVTNVVSAKPISRAICCIVCAARPAASGKTASWLPPKPAIGEHVVVKVPVAGNAHARCSF